VEEGYTVVVVGVEKSNFAKEEKTSVAKKERIIKVKLFGNGEKTNSNETRHQNYLDST
jgi:hypothetical protein